MAASRQPIKAKGSSLRLTLLAKNYPFDFKNTPLKVLVDYQPFADAIDGATGRAITVHSE
jgi:hypothetical protein